MQIEFTDEAYNALRELQNEDETFSDTIVRLYNRLGQVHNRIYVDSSLLDWIEYDDTDLLLRLGFNSGRIYEYLDVPKEEFDGLRDASSKGSYFNSHIKGVYGYYRIR